MGYQIHFLGQEVKQVNSQEDAVFHLGAKYGATIYNQAVKEGYIKFFQDYVKVLPFEHVGTKNVYGVNGQMRQEVCLKSK
jgi:hypothetical protein